MRSTIVLQNLEEKSHIERTVEENSSLTIFVYSFGDSPVDATVSVQLSGRNATAMIYGFFINQGNNTTKIKTLQHHQQYGCTSNLLIKSVLFDESQFSYEGIIRVEKEGQKTDAYQKNENLLISSKAYAQSKPSLEILADDVRCTHGATIGTIDREALFYLQTRGISQASSIYLIVQGFFDDMLSRISDTIQTVKIQKQVCQRLLKQLQFMTFPMEE
ncbi:MAG: SufD family Fe-S cluster assembly protein [Patescibacteria group bacterium]|nr:SufD family Fe-S cluster assembly protein [Patescibacteria group bacterium]